MARTPDAQALKSRYERAYARACAPAALELERCVQGCDYGATSWTTRAGADQMAERLALRPRTRLLDVGSGAGWPALYLAQQTGCDVTLTDVPLAGLRVAIARARSDGFASRCLTVAADGAKLPFRDRAFDAVTHSDVLCCMPAKLEMLHECRRVVQAGARMDFSVISVVPDLSEAERLIAIEGGPEFVDAPGDYADLLAQTGWRARDRDDVTAEFACLAQILVEGTVVRREALTELMGSEDFAERLQHRQNQLAALERGVLKRERFLAVADAT